MTTSATPTMPSLTRTDPGRWRGRVLSRFDNCLRGVGLLVAYWLLSFINSPKGFSAADPGGKVATLKMMAANSSYTDVGIGYWAAAWDPTGALHPLFNTSHIGDSWVQVTTLPMLLASFPLYRLGGYRLALLPVMLGAVACAYAASALTRRFGGDPKSARLAFWIIGLASPVTIYALHFWEHTLGLALMAWGTVALLDLVDADQSSQRVVKSLLAGLAFSTAATMRTEAFVYLGVAAIVVAFAILWRRHRIRPWIAPAAALVSGVAVPLVADYLLSEWIYGDSIREARTVGAASGFGSDPLLRIQEGLVSTVGLFGDDSWGAIAFGLLATACIVLAARTGRAPVRRDRARLVNVLIVCMVILYGAVLVHGLGFVPGIVGTAPIAAVGATVAWRPPVNRYGRIAAITALIAIPVVWAVQWHGGAATYWSGRFMLLSLLLLVAVGVTGFKRLASPLCWTLVFLSVAVTVLGLTWMSVRTRGVEELFAQLDGRAEPVLIYDYNLPYLPREGGPTYGDHRSLITPRAGDLGRAARVVEGAGYSSFAFIQHDSDERPRMIGQFSARNTDKVESIGRVFYVTSYSLE